jgi:hypothetical protein
MTKVRLHPALLEFRGAMKDMLFRQQNGKTFVSVKPDLSNVEPTPAQAAHRERFSEAVAYGKTVMADTDLRALYEQAAKEKGTPVFALTVADFLNAPSIKEVDLSAYKGQANDIIKIKATDDFSVASVHVALVNPQNNDPIENGFAIETAPGSGLWIYTVTVTMPGGSDVRINVVATDRPGGTAVDSKIKTI